LLTSTEISQQLIDQSPQDTSNSSSSNNSNKVALLVMGTIIGHELAPSPEPAHDDVSWWQMGLQAGQAIGWQVWNWAWVTIYRAVVATRQTLLGWQAAGPEE
jgi:hypothetical protein